MANQEFYDMTMEERLSNAARPEGRLGRVVLDVMNQGTHARLAAWAFAQVPNPAPDARVLDVGCGGGANLARHLARSPQGHVTGVDYSPTSVETSRETNAQAIAEGRCMVVQGDVSQLPFADASFDLVSAFETIYFWPSLADGFAEIHRVLRPGGTLMVVNETDVPDPAEPLTVYSREEIRDCLEAAGFSDVRTSLNGETGWILVLATA